jgi:hypothetical protein
VEVAIKNTGADAHDITLVLAPQTATDLVNKSLSQIKIDSIKKGETVVKAFSFAATADARNGYSTITVTLAKGAEQLEQQFSGINIINPKKEEDKPPGKLDVPVVIISRFSYENIDDTGSAPADNQSGFAPEPDDSGEIFFSPTGRIIAMPESSISVPMPDGSMPGGSSGGSSTVVTPSNIESNAVFGGKSFIFSFELLNTHKSVAVRDLKITISSLGRGTQQGGIFTPKSGSNTFFIEYLGPGETIEQNLPLLVKSDAAPDSYGLTISMSYKNEDGEPSTAEEIINIPVQQEMRFSIGDIPPISDAEMGDEVYVTVNFGNLGKSLIYNSQVRVQGEGFYSPEGTYYAGNIEAGKYLTKEFYLITTMSGFLNGNFIFVYEDADGNIFEESQPFYFNVTGGDMNFGEWESYPEDIIIDPETGLPVINTGEMEEEEPESILKWIIIGAAALVLIAGVIIIIVAVKRKKAKNREDDDDDESNGGE